MLFSKKIISFLSAIKNILLLSIKNTYEFCYRISSNSYSQYHEDLILDGMLKQKKGCFTLILEPMIRKNLIIHIVFIKEVGQGLTLSRIQHSLKEYVSLGKRISISILVLAVIPATSLFM